LGTRQQPPYLLPLPASARQPDSETADAPAVVERISNTITALDFLRQSTRGNDKPLRLLLRRLIRVRSLFEKLAAAEKNEK
jgi:hypothetical protein